MFPELSVRHEEYQHKFPHFCRPKVIGYLSLDGSRRLLHNASQLKFVHEAKNRLVNFDLNFDLHKATRADNARDERISHLLQYLLSQERRLHTLLKEEGLSLKKAKFMCYRGLLTCIANTPYETREGWRVVATLYRGQIFLCGLDTEESKKQKQQMTAKDLQFRSWGYKFEQYMLADAPTSVPDTTTSVNENEEFSLLLSTELGAHSLLYAAEMDGILCDSQVLAPPPESEGQDAMVKYLSSKKFVELKTNRHIEFPKQETNFRRFKARKWWCQSFLAGVETIVCGLRDDLGLVEELKVYRVADLPRMCEKFWSPNVCFNFVETFLTYVKRCLAREVARLHGEQTLHNISAVPPTTLHLEWSPHQRVAVTECDPQADAILPEWFLNSYCKYSE